MNALKYSLAALLALGMVNCVVAEEQQETEAVDTKAVQTEAADKAASAEETKTDKTVPPSTKTSIMDALKGTTIGGYVYSQYTGMFGDDADGQALRFRTRIDINTGSYYGFSVGTSVYASVGDGGPNGGTFLGNSGGNPGNDLTIGLKTLYGRQTFESSATVITAGKLNLITPFTDKGFDAGYGITVDNYDVKGIGFHLQGYGAWALDNGNSIPAKWEPFTPSLSLSSTSSPNLISSSPLFIFGISGDRKELAGVGFELWAAHAVKTIDFLAFADLNYTIAGVTLQAQVAATQVNASSQFFNAGGTADDNTSKDLSAKLRGLYNIQIAYNANGSGVKAAVGYTGSFGDGYGALFNNSAFNMGGNIWYDTVGGGANGYGMTGAGGFKNKDGSASTIQVIYASLGFKGIKNLSMSLDYAWVSGDNYVLMKKGQKRRLPVGAPITNTTKTYLKDANFHEVSLSATYAFTDKLSMSVLGGSTFGDLQMARARVKVNYSF